MTSLLNDKKHTQSPSTTSTVIEDRLAKAFLYLSIATGIVVIANISLVFALLSANNKERVFVQLIDGSSVEVVSTEPLFRSQEVIQETTTQFFKLLWEWSDRLPGSTEPDPGFSFTKVGQGKLTIPSNVYWASQLADGGIGNQLIQEAARLIPPEVFTGLAESSIDLEFLSTPRQVGDGLYEIDVLATVIVRRVGQLDQKTRLQKTLVWQAVNPYLPLLGKENPSPMRQLMAQLRHTGLSLVDVKPFNPQ
ncbi:MAG: hypothetical protein AB4058_06470 [Microcystaceae cyanobacterium]